MTLMFVAAARTKVLVRLCPQCRTMQRPGYRCGVCGRPLEMSKSDTPLTKCQGCGRAIPEGVACPFCGREPDQGAEP